MQSSPLESLFLFSLKSSRSRNSAATVRWIAALVLRGLSLFVWLPATFGALHEYDFVRAQSSLGWEPAHQVTVETGTNGLVVNSLGSDGYLTSPKIDLPDVGEYFLRVQMRTEVEGPLQVFYFKEGESASEARSVHFTTRRFSFGETCLSLPLRGSGWRIRFDMPPDAGKTEISRIRIEELGEVGVTRVTVEGQQIVLRVEGVEGLGQVVALAPWDPLHDVARARTVAVQNFRGPATLRIPRYVLIEGNRHDRLYHRFVVRRPLPQPLNFETLGAPRHVQTFAGTGLDMAPFPTVSSPKGLQVQMLDDALELGIRHAALNVNLSGLVDLVGSADSYRHEVDGRTYYFHKGAIDQIPVRQLSDAGVVVSLIVLAYESGNTELNRRLLHPGYVSEAPNKLGAFNTVTEEGFRQYRACWEFLAKHFSGEDAPGGRAVNFIVGNEVTAHWHWANQGEVPTSLFVEDYLRAVRAAHTAVRTASAHSRVYISLDHHWNLVYQNLPSRAIAGRDLVDRLSATSRMEGDFEWHMAYHPYPENLFNARTWEDRTATGTFETPRITFKNLQVLGRYLEQAHLLWEGRPRRVILSEQGFHSDGTPEGEQLQAAAYAYAWNRIRRMNNVDSFIFHRHVDHAHEGGLNLGLWRRKEGSVATPDTRKPIYEVFRLVDTPESEEATRFALPIIGIEHWEDMGEGEL